MAASNAARSSASSRVLHVGSSNPFRFPGRTETRASHPSFRGRTPPIAGLATTHGLPASDGRELGMGVPYQLADRVGLRETHAVGDGLDHGHFGDGHSHVEDLGAFGHEYIVVLNALRVEVGRREAGFPSVRLFTQATAMRERKPRSLVNEPRSSLLAHPVEEVGTGAVSRLRYERLSQRQRFRAEQRKAEKVSRRV